MTTPHDPHNPNKTPMLSVVGGKDLEGPKPGSFDFALKQIEALIQLVSDQIVKVPDFETLELADANIAEMQAEHGALYPDVYKTAVMLVSHITEPKLKVREFLIAVRDGYNGKRKTLVNTTPDEDLPYHGVSKIPPGVTQTAMMSGTGPLHICVNEDCPVHKDVRPGRLFRLEAGYAPGGAEYGKMSDKPVVGVAIGGVALALAFLQPDPKTVAAAFHGHRTFFYAPHVGMIGPARSKHRTLITKPEHIEGIDFSFPMGEIYKAMAEAQIAGVFPTEYKRPEPEAPATPHLKPVE